MLDFLYVAVSWVLLRWHDLFVLLGFSETSGLGWVLSIVFLVITARVLLFRLFVKQVHYQRNMQKMQPKIQKIREKYKNDKAEMNRQMMKFQQEEGFNPLSGCLPMLLQIPVFIGLFHVLKHLAAAAGEGYRQMYPDRLTLYTFSRSETLDAAKAKIFGAPLAASFRDGAHQVATLGGDVVSTRFVILPLLVISAAATFFTQLLVRANATTTPEGTAATVQRLMLYIVPLGVMASGLLFNFPLGVLLYWFTSNLWTLGQQAYIIKFHPPTEEAVAPVGQVGKALAPKVGQRPQRAGRAGGSGAVSVSKSASSQSLGDEADSGTGSAARASVPRPGQRPSGGKRPPAKRPAQSKKRR